mgnify:CR=1 FL=1
MIYNYTIYQQALDLQASGFSRFSSITIGIGLAKFLQIVLPQIAYAITAMVITPARLLPIAKLLFPGRTSALQFRKANHWITTYHRLQGFFIWKLGCDLGFFLIVTEYGNWLRAFTLSGLVSYTALQFVVYYIIGQKLILSRFIKKSIKNRPKPIRVTWWKNLASKLFYEEMGVTISQVSGLMVISKVLVDYLAMWITWSAYTIGFFFFNNGGLGFAPFFIFPHVTMSTLYFSIYFGYAMMFTASEFILKSLALRTSLPLWSKKLFFSKHFKQFAATVIVTLMLPFSVGFIMDGWKIMGEVTVQLYGVLDQWEISLNENFPQWHPNSPLTIQCHTHCLERQFIQGPYTVHD